jgi:hypothetical protein
MAPAANGTSTAGRRKKVAMTTVLTVPGALGVPESLLTQLGGPQALLKQLGDQSTANIVPIYYNNWDPIWGCNDGADKIDVALHAAARANENVVVFGHSYGAVSACMWLREKAGTSGLDPARVTFVLIGNSVRPNNGLAAMWRLYGGFGPATGTGFRVIDAARQWDKWADYPNVVTSIDYLNAVNNVNSGDMLPYCIHISYEKIRLTNPHWQAVVGDVTFMLFPTTPVPLLWTAPSAIEPAYDRIVDTSGPPS